MTEQSLRWWSYKLIVKDALASISKTNRTKLCKPKYTTAIYCLRILQDERRCLQWITRAQLPPLLLIAIYQGWKTELNQCPCCIRLERRRPKLNTALTLWDRKAAPRTALWLGCSVGIEGEEEQHRAGRPSLEWLPTRGIDTSLALAPWSDKKRSPWTWTPSWRQNAAETSASRPPSLGSQVMTKLTLNASVDRSTLY